MSVSVYDSVTKFHQRDEVSDVCQEAIQEDHSPVLVREGLALH